MRFLREFSGQRIFLFVAAVAPVVLLITITIYDVQRTVIPEDSDCMGGGHKCNQNSTICIHHSQWCDGNVDCPFGEDEEQRICHDGGSLSSELATCLHSMNELRPKVNNRTSTAFDVVFNYCGGLCNCKRFPTISCRKKELVEIPPNLPNNTFNLVLSMNNISEIKPEMFRDTKFLQGLKLDRNSIKHLASRAFADLHHLERLVLHTNLLEEILPDVFQCRKLKYIDLSANRIKFIHAKSFNSLPSLGCLMLENNMLGSHEPIIFSLPPKCSYVDLSQNMFKIIRKDTFTSCPGVKTLLFEKNSIVKLENNAFEKCSQLTDLIMSENNISSLPLEFQEEAAGYSTIEHLDVANNPLSWISQETLLNLPNLFSLNLSGVPVINLNKRSFQSMRNFFSIEFSTFEMCRYAPSVIVCKPKTDGISTIYNLLDVSILGVFVWIVGMVTCFGNLLVMICRTAFKEEKNIHSLFIKNLAAADFMLGVYLLVIGSHDVMYRDHYNRFALDWMESWTCRATGFMGVMSIEVSVFILTCMSLECCLTVCFPLQPRTMTVGRAVGLLMVIWLSGAVIAGVPILFVSHFGQFYGSNGVCLPLYIHDPYMGGWQYSTFIFNFVNVIGMLVIIASYSIIFYNMRRTRARIPVVLTTVANSGGTIVTDDQLIRKMKNLDKRLFIIVLTNILCWIPISIIKLLALYSIHFPSLSHAWLTIFIIPINSALNPIIYSVTTPTFRRKFKTCCNLRKIQDDFRRFALSLRTHLRGTERPRYMSKVSGGTAMSFLGLQDILLLHRYRVSSASSQNRNEESFETHRLNNDAGLTTVTIEYKHSKRKTLPSRMRAFSLTGAEVLMTVPKVGWSMIPRRNSLGPGVGHAFRESFVRSTQL